MNKVYFNTKRLLTLPKDDLILLLTGIKMVFEEGVSEISINTENIKATVTRDYKTNIVKIHNENHNYGLMAKCYDSGAMAYYALAVLESDNPKVSMDFVIDMFSKKAMSYSTKSNSTIAFEREQYRKDMQTRLVISSRIVSIN